MAKKSALRFTIKADLPDVDFEKVAERLRELDGRELARIAECMPKCPVVDTGMLRGALPKPKKRLEIANKAQPASYLRADDCLQIITRTLDGSLLIF